MKKKEGEREISHLLSSVIFLISTKTQIYIYSKRYVYK